MGSKTRRAFLRTWGLGSAAVVLAACVRGGLPRTMAELNSSSGLGSVGLLTEADRALFYVYNERPLAAETRRSAFQSRSLTPTGLLFVRNNLPMPEPVIVQAANEWVLEVSGTQKPARLSLLELKALGRTEEVAVLQCSGNGRAFFEHGASGSQWRVGAAGCVKWAGVRVSDVVKHLGGTLPEAQFLTATGGETLPEGVDPMTVLVERSVPLEKGMKDCILAWELNGEPVSLTHGGPLRLIVPGYFGCNNIKYVRAIAFSQAESNSKIQRTGYRFRPIGEKGDPSQPSMWRMPVKSWINGLRQSESTPQQEGKGSVVEVHGVAFSGERGVDLVEVSFDNGTSWQVASLESGAGGENSWRPFTASSLLAAGTHRIASRARDSEGDIQPMNRLENERGYGHNGWRDAALIVDVAQSGEVRVRESVEEEDPMPTAGLPSESAPRLSESAQRGEELFQATAQPPCGACHTVKAADAAGIVGPNLDTMRPDEGTVVNALQNGVGVMPSYADQFSDAQMSDIARYLREVIP